MKRRAGWPGPRSPGSLQNSRRMPLGAREPARTVLGNKAGHRAKFLEQSLERFRTRSSCGFDFHGGAGVDGGENGIGSMCGEGACWRSVKVCASVHVVYISTASAT